MPATAEAVRGQLAVVTSAAVADLSAEAAQVAPEKALSAIMDALPAVVSTYYDAAGALAVSWYDELRDAAKPPTSFAPAIVGDPTTDWIEREVAKLQQSIEADLESEMQRFVDEATRLAEKEIARGFRATIIGNTHADEDAVGWSRVARPDGCPFCKMLAAKGAVFTEETARFASHLDCGCAARPEFHGGEHGPEADVLQYVASQKKRTEAQKVALKQYLHENFGAPQPRETRDTDGKGKPTRPQDLGFASLSRDQIELQIRITEQLKASEWRDRQLSRLRARLAEL